jgi:hypothetical protein
MHGWTGFATLLVGLGIAGYVFHPGTVGIDASALIERAAAPEPAPPAVAAAPATNRTRLFSPQMPLFGLAGPAQAEAKRPAGDGPAPATATVATITTQPWTTVVQPQVVSEAGRPRTSRPEGPEARADLVRDLQRELKRLGCYEGEVDGSWGGGSKRAMTAFNERVNATLPVEEPDFILLTLLQGSRDAACGDQPRTQTAQAGGKNKRQGGPSGAAAVVVTDQVARAEPKSQRASDQPAAVHAPVVESRVAAVAEAAAVAGVASAVVRDVTAVPAAVAAVPSVPPAARKAAPHPAVAAAPVEPLPGRMTIGGPVPPAVAERTPVAAARIEPAEAPHAAPAHRPATARRAPAPVAAPAPRHRPAQYVYSGGGGSSSAARQRSMVYNLFQRPDRLY